MKLRSKAFITFILLSVIYLSVNLIAAPPRSTLDRYHISAPVLRLIDSTIIFPVVVIWFIGLYGYQKLRTYADYVRGSKEGKHIMQLSHGITVLAYWLPVGSTVSAVLSLFARNHHGMVAGVTVATNYISLLFPLIAFVFISRGARGLSEVNKQRPKQSATHLLAITLVCMAVLYAYLVTKAHASLYTIYHMPLELVLLTLVVPYVFTWYLGLTSVSDLQTYSRSVQGHIYRKSWKQLSFGIIWIIIMGIVFQFIVTISARLGHLSLTWLMLLIYGILAILALGYVFIALGAKKLTKIEEL